MNRGKRFFGEASGCPNGGAAIDLRVTTAEGGVGRMAASFCAFKAVSPFLACCQVYS